MIAEWHPIMAANEVEPGHWMMLDTNGKPYGVIRFLKRGDQLGYRAVTWAPESKDRQLIGYYKNLRAAAAAAHRKFIDKHSGAPASGVPTHRAVRR